MKIHLPFLLLFFVSSASLARADSEFRAFQPVDNPDLITAQSPFERNLQRLDALAPRQMNLNIHPWADGQWSIAKGLLAERYADPAYAGLDDWSSRHDYIERYSVAKILSDTKASRRQKRIDELSIAEKYDLLVGDKDYTLSNSNWAIGQEYEDAGTLATWMGICEGSAVSGVVYPEPKHSVTLQTPQGDSLTFHILDIKGLASLLWSSYNVNIPVAGPRCTNPHPAPDSNGVFTDQNCFDINPGAWHIALLNLLGHRQQPLYINRVMSVEVWNVPVVSYQLYYLNAKGFRVDQLTDAIIPLAQISHDKYRAYRDQRTTSIVNVRADIVVGSGTTRSRDSSALTALSPLTYQYDLELDASGQIIGGEWHSDHPEFMWAITNPNFKPLSIGDSGLGGLQWSGGVVPASWLDSARLSSSHNQPLAAIVNELLRESSQ